MMRRTLLTAVVITVALIPPAAANAHGGAPLGDLENGRVAVPQRVIGGLYAMDGRLYDGLQQRTAESERLGYPVKIVLSQERFDVVSVPEMFRKPNQYARFLGEVLYGEGFRGIVISVMPNGFGVYPPERPEDPLARIRDVPIVKDPDVDDLARSGIAAIERLNAAAKTGALGETRTSTETHIDRPPLWWLDLVAAAAIVLSLWAGLVRAGLRRVTR